MPTIQAQDIVNAVIQDSQNQTTNRTALYDYVDRVHQRILRESQWRFLLSDPQYFVTMPGVGAYNLTSGSPPPGAFQTNLNLTDFANIAPSTVFNTSSWTKIEEDSDAITSLNYFLQRDGSLRFGYPRTYTTLISNPGTIVLKPVPNNQNQYFPVPETPVVTYAPGGSLPNRIYYGVATFVDNLSGESTQCHVPFAITVPANNLLTVQSPNASIGNIAGNQTVYGWWNVYIGLAINVWTRQNTLSIPIGTSWTEPTTGITLALQVPSATIVPAGTSIAFLGILHTGQLTTTLGPGPGLFTFWALQDTSGGLWQVTADTSGFLHTTSLSGFTGTVNVFTQILLTDTAGISTWKIFVDTSGVLHSTLIATPPTTQAINAGPPTTATIQPLNAYVIQFRYYKIRNQIANPTDVLQIPYMYKDIVIAGVNYLAGLYMDRLESREASSRTMNWKRDFDQGLAQIRRDLRINYRKTDYINPDPVSQYVIGNQQGIPTMGW